MPQSHTAPLIDITVHCIGVHTAVGKSVRIGAGRFQLYGVHPHSVCDVDSSF